MSNQSKRKRTNLSFIKKFRKMGKAAAIYADELINMTLTEGFKSSSTESTGSEEVER